MPFDACPRDHRHFARDRLRVEYKRLISFPRTFSPVGPKPKASDPAAARFQLLEYGCFFQRTLGTFLVFPDRQQGISACIGPGTKSHSGARAHHSKKIKAFELMELFGGQSHLCKGPPTIGSSRKRIKTQTDRLHAYFNCSASEGFTNKAAQRPR